MRLEALNGYFTRSISALFKYVLGPASVNATYVINLALLDTSSIQGKLNLRLQSDLTSLWSTNCKLSIFHG